MRGRILWYLGVGGILLILAFTIKSLIGGLSAPTLDTTAVLPEMVADLPTFRFWFGMGVLGLLVWAIANFFGNTGSFGQRIHGCLPPAWGFLVLIGITTFHWLLWSVAPEFWSAWYKSPNFFPMNVAIVLALFLGSQRGTIRYMSYALWALIAVTALAKVWTGVPEWFTRGNYTGAPAKAGVSAGLLPIIAQCESGGRQFDDEGNLITNPKSTAVGKYQIMASLHEERAKKMGFDIRTAEGNEQYARVLYAEFGTEPWEASKGCWGPKLYTLSGSTSTDADFDTTYTTKPNIPAQAVVPRGWAWEAWYDETKILKTVLMKGTDKIVRYSTKPGVEEAEVRIRVFPMTE